jgi:hypothetical protein
VEDLSPGRGPWVPKPSPRLRHPSPARAGEGKGEREGASTHGLRRGLSYVAPSELSYAANFGYRTPAGHIKRRPRLTLLGQPFASLLPGSR